MPVKDLDILKAIILREAETETLPQGFEDDPMGFILKKYPGLNEVMTYLMTKEFKEFVDAIFVVAPKPTTFKIVLHNGQFFFLQFMGKTYQATVGGKNYYLMTIGEKERCMLAIARLLRYGNPLKTKGPEGAEQGTRPEGEEGGAGGEAGAEVPEATPEEGGEGLEEAMILEEILKKTLKEDADSEYGDDTKKYEIAAKNKLNAQIQSILKSPSTDNKKSITIVVNNKEYPNIVRAEVVRGSQNKSDIKLIDSKKIDRIFISHKDKGGPTRFARWGSIQYLFNEGYKEVLNFRNNIYNYAKSLNNSGVSTGNLAINKDDKIILYRSATFSQKISSDLLKNKIVFGKNFTEEKYGLNNVQLVVQGDIVLKEIEGKPGFYEFDVNGSEKIWFNGTTPSGEYEPVMHVHWREKSSDELDILHGETMAKPIASVSGILWEAGETLNPSETYLPKNAIIVPKDEKKIIYKEDKPDERDIFVSQKWKESFERKMQDKNKKPREYKKYFDTEDKRIKGFVRIEPSFRKDFYFSL